jgi:DNA-binding NarL/FixJ family response regulator
MIRVLIVDDHALVRRTLRAVLEAEASLKVVGEAVDGQDAIRLAQEVRPDVVLMDLYMPEMDGIESTRRIHALLPETCIIGMSSDSRVWVGDAFRSAGGRAFVAKELVPVSLVEVTETACAP